ncbi:uncharacterized protein LOC112554153 [Pomacea canaliculata]|uniref:uncharacterized protein LOC112554153 n=1 Tax=Pomacea canaliculata TaxID=400727 RepID=UPI000D73D1DD|nr:uncharacterized protein LOC112554153 [Pomacea canaliculata]
MSVIHVCDDGTRARRDCMFPVEVFSELTTMTAPFLKQWMSALCRHPQSFSNPSSKSASSIATQIISNRAVSAKTSASPTASFSVVSSSSLMAKESNLLSASTPLMLLVRGRARIHYQPSAWKRVNKHGLEKRLLTQSGIEVLWRRYLKDRHVLTPFERILSGTYNGQILPDIT